MGCGNANPAQYQRSVFDSGNNTNSVFVYNPTNTSNTLKTPEPTKSDSSSNSKLTAAIYVAGQKQEGSDSVNLVRVPGQEEIYEIVGGKKHLIPNMDIFYDYGFKLEMVQKISVKDLAKYPRVKLLRVNGDKKKTYYFTEGGMVRLIPHKSVSESYGDRDEDIMVISKKEFNFYPKNQFVFLEQPLKRDVFQIVDGKKRFITPMAVKRMKIKEDVEVAPVNQIEITYYKTGDPIVF